MNSFFTCPVCGQGLLLKEKTLVCPSGHSYDLARQGYVNLLRSQQSGKKRHGDDRKMVHARTEFLDSGAYSPLLDALCELSLSSPDLHLNLLDVGCGEGWYTSHLTEFLCRNGKTVTAAGVDISRDALSAAGKRDPAPELAVASVTALPVASRSVSVLLNVFAPVSAGEFLRVLRPNGLFLRVVPLEEHLAGLKEIVYDTPIPNTVEPVEIEGFSLKEERILRYDWRTENPSLIRALFWMTPYAYKTSAADQQKLERAERLETPVAFSVRVYTPKN